MVADEGWFTNSDTAQYLDGSAMGQFLVPSRTEGCIAPRVSRVSRSRRPSPEQTLGTISPFASWRRLSTLQRMKCYSSSNSKA